MMKEIQTILIDGSLITSREEFFEAVRSQLPPGLVMGSNLDALHDMMGELPEDAYAFTIFYGGTGIPHKQQVTIAKILLRKA